MSHTFKRVDSTDVLFYFKKLLKSNDYCKILKGILNFHQYIYFPELEVIINTKNVKECYVVKKE